MPTAYSSTPVWQGDGEMQDGSGSFRRVRVSIREGWLGIESEGDSPLWWRCAEVQIERAGFSWKVRRAVQGRESSPPLLIHGHGFEPAFRSAAASAPIAANTDPRFTLGAGLLIILLTFVAAIVLVWKVALPGAAGWAAGKIPPDWEAEVGAGIAESITPPEARCTNPDSARELALITGRLKAASARGKEYDYRVAVARGPVVNAFAAPGGFIVLHEGLIESMESEAELAAVLAHEMQHVALRHSTRAIFRAFALRALLGLLLGDLGAFAGEAAAGLGELKYAREDEEEADSAGLEALAKAGYPPGAMLAMLGRLQSHSRDVPGALTWLSTHPASEARIKRLEPAVERLGETEDPGRSVPEAIRTACAQP